MEQAPRSRLWVWWVTTLLACAHFAISYVTNHEQFLDLAAYAQGQERTPYQYRILTAWIMRLFVGNAPTSSLSNGLGTQALEPYLAVEAGLAMLCLFGAILATRRSLEILLRNRTYALWASPVVLYMAYFHYALPYGLNYVFPYDLPSVMFFSLAFWAILARRRPLFYVFFTLGTLNRETILLAAVPFAVWELIDASGNRRPDGWKTATIHLLAQVALWGTLKGLVAWSLLGRPHNPTDSGLLEIHLGGNLRSILKPYQWPLLFSCFGFTLPFLIANRRGIGDFRLRRSIEILLPLWGLCMLVVGVVVEIRVFGEMIVPMALGVAAICQRFVCGAEPQVGRS